MSSVWLLAFLSRQDTRTCLVFQGTATTSFSTILVQEKQARSSECSLLTGLRGWEAAVFPSGEPLSSLKCIFSFSLFSLCLDVGKSMEP